MKSPQTYVIVALALTTLGGAGVMWNQYRELVDLRASAMNSDERADWQKRAWDLETLNRELQDQLAALQAANGDDLGGMPADGADRTAPEPGRGRFGGGRGGRGPNGPQQQMNAIRDLVSKPEVQALLRVQQQAAIDARYSALFRNLNLPPEQLARLKNLLAERQTTVQDVMTAARDQGIEPRSDPAGFRKLIADAQNEINNGIKSIVGDSGFAQLQNYEQTMPQRNLVNDLQQRLSYTTTPLTPTQADQLVQILASTAPQGRSTNGGTPVQGQPPQFRGDAGPGFGGGFGGGQGPGLGERAMLAGALGGGPGGFANMVGGGGTFAAPVTSAAITQAQTILAPTQVTALQQIQQQQQSQQQLQQLLRDTVGNQRPGGNRGGNSGSGQAPPVTGGGSQGQRGGG